MLKIHRYICAGLDVHKTLIVVTTGTADKKSNVTEYTQKHFNTYNYKLISL